MIKVGDVLTDEDVVGLVGSEKQIESFKKCNSLYGNTKKSIFKKFNSICKYKVIKTNKRHAYKIIEVYDKPKEIIDKRINNCCPRLVYENMCRLQEWGIYAITTKNGIYIGSTKNFKHRHHQHIKTGLASNIKDEFNILWCDGLRDRDLLYEIENIAIDMATNSGIELINKKKPSSFTSINIKIEDLKLVEEILKANNIEYR